MDHALKEWSLTMLCCFKMLQGIHLLSASNTSEASPRRTLQSCGDVAAWKRIMYKIHLQIALLFLGGGNSNIFYFQPENWGRFPF